MFLKQRLEEKTRYSRICMLCLLSTLGSAPVMPLEGRIIGQLKGLESYWCLERISLLSSIVTSCNSRSYIFRLYCGDMQFISAAVLKIRKQIY